jgi:UDP-N-acetylenolpyruvoylglucosamine reductase
LPQGFIETEVTFSFKAVFIGMAARMRQVNKKRQATQPHGYPNAGSIFKKSATRIRWEIDRNGWAQRLALWISASV